MKNFAAIDIIKSFSPDEVKRFDKFIRSPYFGGSSYIANFWKELKKYYPDFHKEKFNKEKLYKKIYPGKKYDDNLLRKLYSELFKMCESFLAVEMIADNNIMSGWMVLNQYNNRRLHAQFENKFKKVDEELESISDFDYWVILRRHNIYTQKVNSLIFKNQSHKLFAERMVTLENIIGYTLILVLEEETRHKHSKDIFKTESKFNIAREFLASFDIEFFIQKLKLSSGRYAEIIELHHNLVKMTSGLNKADEFEKVKDYLFFNWIKMSKKSAFMYFTALLNYCQQHTNSGLKTFDRKIVEVMDFMDANKFILYSDKEVITPQLFRSFYVSYLDAYELGKAVAFLEKYKKYLEPEVRDDIIGISYADYYFAKKDFEKTIEHLSNIQPVIFLDKINIRLIKLICYYETNRTEQCYSLIDSIRNFLRMNKIVSPGLSEGLEIFLKYYKMLCDSSFQNKIKKEDIIIEFQNSPDFMDKHWVQEKIELLK